MNKGIIIAIVGAVVVVLILVRLLARSAVIKQLEVVHDKAEKMRAEAVEQERVVRQREAEAAEVETTECKPLGVAGEWLSRGAEDWVSWKCVRFRDGWRCLT